MCSQGYYRSTKMADTWAARVGATRHKNNHQYQNSNSLFFPLGELFYKYSEKGDKDQLSP